MKNDIFIKKSELPVKYDSIDIETVRETIPKTSYTVSQPLLAHMVENRWRFIHVPSNKPNNDNSNDKIIMRKFVEISRKKPYEEREYLNRKMEWTKSSVDTVFDNYVAQQYFCYTDE